MGWAEDCYLTGAEDQCHRMKNSRTASGKPHENVFHHETSHRTLKIRMLVLCGGFRLFVLFALRSTFARMRARSRFRLMGTVHAGGGLSSPKAGRKIHHERRCLLQDETLCCDSLRGEKET